jgi:nucleoside 2-deoxyribosyltransferase
MKIYIASPLFTEEEKKVINWVRNTLVMAGHEVYLPMENGVPDAWSYNNKDWARCLFEIDVKAIDNCEAIVCIYYGMDSDSGTSWEIGYGFAKNKIIVVYHRYDITHIDGSLMICNSAFSNVFEMKDIPKSLEVKINNLPYQS